MFGNEPEGNLTRMGLFKWLYHLPERVNLGVEKTALASSIDADEAGQVNPVGVKSGLGCVQVEEPNKEDPGNARGS